MGSAQRRSGGVILQQSSVRHFEAPVDAQAVLLGPVGHGGYPLSRFDEDEVEKAFVAGFEKAFGIRSSTRLLEPLGTRARCVCSTRPRAWYRY